MSNPHYPTSLSSLIFGFLSQSILALALVTSSHAAEPAPISLAGTWAFELDDAKKGIDERWFTRDLADNISLPGTTDEGQKGARNDRKEHGRLSQRFIFTGPAWYQRTVDIPDDWSGKRLELFLERTRSTRVWFDDIECGTQESLVTPHIYELSAKVKPGRHRLTIMVDNGNLPPVGRSHQIAEHTQTNWNGIVGRIELRATDAVWLEHIKAYPLHEERAFRVIATLGGQTVTNGTMNVAIGSQHVEVPIAEGAHTAEATLPLGTDASTWDEWKPALHRVAVTIQGKTAAGAFRDRREVSAGLRSFSAKGTQFAINGRTTFLRGKNDACVFPLTGYAPMDKESWKAQMAIAKSYGINHYRFHSWCPPAAAFEAADELGIYLQPELPYWGGYGDKEHWDYMLREGKRLLDAYGNHPSFVMMSLGNELAGSREMMAQMVAALRSHDPRHLYAQGSNNVPPQQNPGDDFWITMRTSLHSGNVRGSFSRGDAPLGRVQTGPPNTLDDYKEAIKGIKTPVIGHEVGQYQIYPDFKEIPRYTGVLEARNLIFARESLKSRGMLDQAEDFLQASGRLAALCYRADMELALRTRGMGGFQLLDLQDFPGQGTALVGILNAFMESKGLITPEDWRQSCNQRVLLARLPAYTWTTDQPLSCGVEIFNYGPEALPGAVVEWQLQDSNGAAKVSGRLPAVDSAQGALSEAGKLSISLAGLQAPARYTLRLAMGAGTEQVINEYPIWVYPPSSPEMSDHKVRVSDRLDPATLDHLAQGGSVLLTASAELLAGRSVPGFFTPDFWCWSMFQNTSGIMGLLMDPKHPALAGFPTAFHSDWQWFDIAMSSTPVILDDLPAGHRPIVQVIDNFTRCHRLGLVDGFTYNGGRILLVACESDKLNSSIAGRALLASLRSYATSEAFRPLVPLPKGLSDRLVESLVDLTQPGVTASAASSKPGFPPANALDSNPETLWSAIDNKPNVSWQVDLGRTHTLGKASISWEMLGGYRCIVEGSTDGTTWQLLSNCDFNAASVSNAVWEPKPVRHLRITVNGLGGERWAAIREVRLFEKAPSQKK